jgi:hypothetical protein
MKNVIIPPTLSELASELEFISQQMVDSIPGVIVFDSGIPGPTIGITAMTHSNEPSGLAAIWFYRRAGNLANRIKKGKVIMVLNNLESSFNYFKFVQERNKQQSRLARFKDKNMNRLPKDSLTLLNDQRYEVKRAQELLPIWRQFDFALDIHSTSQEAPPMIVTVGGFYPKIIKDFPIEIIITNCENIQIGVPACYFYGAAIGTIPSMVLETGYYENQVSFLLGIECVERLLSNLGVIDEVKKENIMPQNFTEYKMNGSLVVPNDSYRMARAFKWFELIKKGEILADGNQGPILMPLDGQLLFPKGRIEITAKETAEELMFFAEPVKEIIHQHQTQ